MSKEISQRREKIIEEFHGFCFGGTPIINHLILDVPNGMCHSYAPAVVSILEKTKLVRGNLRLVASARDLKNFHHSWVEIDNLVYDTSTNDLMPKKDYYIQFGADAFFSTERERFLELFPNFKQMLIRTTEEVSRQKNMLETLSVLSMNELIKRNCKENIRFAMLGIMPEIDNSKIMEYGTNFYTQFYEFLNDFGNEPLNAIHFLNSCLIRNAKQKQIENGGNKKELGIVMPTARYTTDITCFNGKGIAFGIEKTEKFVNSLTPKKC